MAAVTEIRASIVIICHDRREDLRRAVASSLAQEGGPHEVQVYDDASSDGTDRMMAAVYPEVRYARSPERVGYIVLRNRGFREARGRYVFSIDDDAYFSDRGTVAAVAAFLDARPASAAAAIRYLEPPPVGRTVTSCALENGVQVRNFVGTAYALRRQVALAHGPYKEALVHQGEERDLCIRLLQAGHSVNFVDAPPIVHCVSPKRDLGRMHKWGSRNTVLFDCVHTPDAYLLPVLAHHVSRMLAYRFSVRRFLSTLPHVGRGFLDGMKHRRAGRPVSAHTLRAYYALPAHGPVYTPRADLPGPCHA